MSMTLYNDQEENPTNRAEYEKPENWSRGKIAPSYSSRIDTRMWVPKKGENGLGWQLNTAHPKAKLLAGIIFLGFILFLIAGVINVMWLK